MGHGDDVQAQVLSTLRGWVGAILSMTEPPTLMEILAPCTECGVRFTTEFTDSGEFKRSPALVVVSRTNAPPFAQCRACNSIWHAHQLVELAAWFNSQPATTESAAA
jgi:hypothetical protein